MEEPKRQLISKSSRRNYVSQLGVRYYTQEVVIKTPIGKNKKGKQIFASHTRFIPITQ